jgi:phosphoribosylformylglycinamidine cyclo-ligase
VAQNPNPPSGSITYADAGVNIDRGNRTKQRIKYLAHKTFTKGVLSEIGGFGGLYSVDKKYLDPVLVSSVDGVGTKLKVAFEMKMHHTVGADLVNHCVNDIAVQGACFSWIIWQPARWSRRWRKRLWAVWRKLASTTGAH